ncbi:hypothetical protein ScPMuIL_014907, partial [Solemya velum]
INRDTSARREIKLLPVYCPHQTNYGCPVEIQWKNLQQHIQTCDYRPVDCQYRADGCTEKVALKNLRKHIDSCSFRPMICQHCGVTVPMAKLGEHEDRDCPKVLVTCPFKCGAKKMTREQFNEHRPQCPKKPKECRFRAIGCQFKGTDAEVVNHEKEGMDQHLQMITVYTASIDLQSIEIRRDLQEITNERDALKNQLEENRRETIALKEALEQMKTQNKDIKLKMVKLTERIIILERKIEDMPKKEVIERHTREIKAIEQKQSQMGASPGRHGELGGMAETLMQQLQQHDRELGIHDIRLAELDLRFQVLETASYDGTLLWKIRDYGRRKQEAVTGKTLSLYSQPFHSSRFGYKMCARVYLNGDGMGKNTHMSLFFVIMRGDYDALLKWPFQQKVALVLLDQELGQRNLTDTFRPDITSSSFKQPTSEMNIASGCPLFVAHTILETPTYLKDDTIFIKIQVDVSNLALV